MSLNTGQTTREIQHIVLLELLVAGYSEIKNAEEYLFLKSIDLRDKKTCQKFHSLLHFFKLVTSAGLHQS